MTVILESYTNGEINADIQQEKFSNVYELDMYDNDGHNVYRYTYLTIPDARRAMRRQYKNNFGGLKEVIKTSDWKNEHGH